MDRMACVNLPAMPLQVLMRSHPEWERLPAAVVDRDKPSGLIKWVNERARANRILPGMRYAAGLGLAHELRAGVVTDDEIATQVEKLTRRLARFSPDVEPSGKEPGVFWIDVSGLQRLYPSLEQWSQLVKSDLYSGGFPSSRKRRFFTFRNLCRLHVRFTRSRVPQREGGTGQGPDRHP